MSDYLLAFDPAPINMSYVLIEINTLKIMDWGLFSVKDSTNFGSAQKCDTKLEEMDLTKDINTIIVHEQQPKCNMKTLTICGHLQMFYAKKKNNGHNIEKLVGHPAKHKLNYYEAREGDEPMPERLSKLKKGHYLNKQTAIEHCRRVLKHNGDLEWLKWFEEQKKLDDISDSALTALSYIKMHKLGPYAPKAPKIVPE